MHAGSGRLQGSCQLAGTAQGCRSSITLQLLGGGSPGGREKRAAEEDGKSQSSKFLLGGYKINSFLSYILNWAVQSVPLYLYMPISGEKLYPYPES